MKVSGLNIIGDIKTKTKIVADSDTLMCISKSYTKEKYVQFSSDVIMYLNSDLGRYMFTVKKGYVFDYASIPRAFYWFAEPEEEFLLIASLCHDIVFNHKYKNKKWAADMMHAVMTHVIKSSTASKASKFILRCKARIIKRAVKGRIAGNIFNELSAIDKWNKQHSEILEN